MTRPMTGDEKRQYYDLQSEILRKWAESMSLNLDKIIFGLSTGTLVVSATFIDEITGSTIINYVPWLFSAWGLLLVTVTVNLISHFAVIKAAKVSHGQLNAWAKSPSLEKPDLSNKYTKLAPYLNPISVATLLLGILSLVVFVTLNIKPLTMADTKDIPEEQRQGKFAEPAINDIVPRNEINPPETPATADTPANGQEK